MRSLCARIFAYTVATLVLSLGFGEQAFASFMPNTQIILEAMRAKDNARTDLALRDVVESLASAPNSTPVNRALSSGDSVVAKVVCMAAINRNNGDTNSIVPSAKKATDITDTAANVSVCDNMFTEDYAFNAVMGGSDDGNHLIDPARYDATMAAWNSIYDSSDSMSSPKNAAFLQSLMGSLSGGGSVHGGAPDADNPSPALEGIGAALENYGVSGLVAGQAIAKSNNGSQSQEYMDESKISGVQASGASAAVGGLAQNSSSNGNRPNAVSPAGLGNGEVYFGSTTPVVRAPASLNAGISPDSIGSGSAPGGKWTLGEETLRHLKSNLLSLDVGTSSSVAVNDPTLTMGNSDKSKPAANVAQPKPTGELTIGDVSADDYSQAEIDSGLSRAPSSAATTSNAATLNAGTPSFDFSNSNINFQRNLSTSSVPEPSSPSLLANAPHTSSSIPASTPSASASSAPLANAVRSSFDLDSSDLSKTDASSAPQRLVAQLVKDEPAIEALAPSNPSPLAVSTGSHTGPAIKVSVPVPSSANQNESSNNSFAAPVDVAGIGGLASGVGRPTDGFGISGINADGGYAPADTQEGASWIADSEFYKTRCRDKAYELSADKKQEIAQLIRSSGCKSILPKMHAATKRACSIQGYQLNAVEETDDQLRCAAIDIAASEYACDASGSKPLEAYVRSAQVRVIAAAQFEVGGANQIIPAQKSSDQVVAIYAMACARSWPKVQEDVCEYQKMNRHSWKMISRVVHGLNDQIYDAKKTNNNLKPKEIVPGIQNQLKVAFDDANLKGCLQTNLAVSMHQWSNEYLCRGNLGEKCEYNDEAIKTRMGYAIPAQLSGLAKLGKIDNLLASMDLSKTCFGDKCFADQNKIEIDEGHFYKLPLVTAPVQKHDRNEKSNTVSIGEGI